MISSKTILQISKSIRAYLTLQSVQKLSQVQEDFVYHNLEGEDQGIVIFGLNRPNQKNALSGNLADQLKNALNKVSLDEKARVVILRSYVPDVFCAGADLKERINLPQDQVGPAVANLRNLTDQIQNLSIPVISALDGLALGGGLEIALACDLRVASSNSKMGLVEGKLAIIPGAGGTQRLPRLINPAIAKELIFTAKIIDGAAAHGIGLVNHVIPQNKAGDAAFLKSLELARQILPLGPVAIQMAKKAINQGLQCDIQSAMAVEEACYGQLIPTKDRVEGLKAFSEKRKPNYIGQ